MDVHLTTNLSEAVIKNQVSYKSHQLVQLIEHLKAVVDEQEREVERAVIGWGNYHFKEQYSSLQIPKSVVQEDRKAAIRSFKESSRYQCGGGPHKFRFQHGF